MIMKKTIALLLAVSALSSCSKSKDTPVAPTPPAPRPAPVERLDYIAKIERFNTGKTDKFYEVSFTYDSQKRVTSLVETYPATYPVQVITSKISYSPQTITWVRDENKWQKNLIAPTEGVLSLDANGKAVKLEETYHFDTGANARPDTDYTYDNDGKLAGYKSPIYDSVSLTWQQGNMIKIVYIGDHTRTEIRGYSTSANSTYPDLNLILSSLSTGTRVRYLWSTPLGLRSANLLTSFSDADDGSTSTTTFTYKTDAKGRPTEVEVKDNEESSYIYVITYLEK